MDEKYLPFILKVMLMLDWTRTSSTNGRPGTYSLEVCTDLQASRLLLPCQQTEVHRNVQGTNWQQSEGGGGDGSCCKLSDYNDDDE